MSWLVALFVRILEIMFFVGAIGSTLVLILAAISETRGALSGEEEEPVDRTPPPA
jgi:hypothetical protein